LLSEQCKVGRSCRASFPSAVRVVALEGVSHEERASRVVERCSANVLLRRTCTIMPERVNGPAPFLAHLPIPCVSYQQGSTVSMRLLVAKLSQCLHLMIVPLCPGRGSTVGVQAPQASESHGARQCRCIHMDGKG